METGIIFFPLNLIISRFTVLLKIADLKSKTESPKRKIVVLCFTKTEFEDLLKQQLLCEPVSKYILIQ